MLKAAELAPLAILFLSSAFSNAQARQCVQTGPPTNNGCPPNNALLFPPTSNSQPASPMDQDAHITLVESGSFQDFPGVVEAISSELSIFTNLPDSGGCPARS